MMTVSEMVLGVLADTNREMCNGEIAQAIFATYGVKVQDATISARQRDTLKDKLECVRAKGKTYKVWRLKTKEKDGQYELEV